VYAPVSKDVRLPRVSSKDFTEADMREQEPYLDVVLEPGDMLYLPRGWVHQGITLPGTGTSTNDDNDHSLHLTVSAYQNWAWVDYLEILLPEALQAAATSDKSILLRSGLPRNFLNYMGSMYDQRDDNLPDTLKVGTTSHSGGKDGQENDKKKSEATEDDITDDELHIQRLRLMQGKFREETRKRIMRVAKEVRNQFPLVNVIINIVLPSSH
jgi:Cupin superfamily protein